MCWFLFQTRVMVVSEMLIGLGLDGGPGRVSGPGVRWNALAGFLLGSSTERIPYHDVFPLGDVARHV
jgi:hypothetical protein